MARVAGVYLCQQTKQTNKQTTKKFSKMINYEKLMARNPFVYAELVNNAGQKIQLVEHPTKGDEHPVIAVYHELKLAENTGFYECDDMLAEHGEYTPYFLDGELVLGR